jgi:hypothetical protein
MPSTVTFAIYKDLPAAFENAASVQTAPIRIVKTGVSKRDCGTTPLI